MLAASRMMETSPTRRGLRAGLTVGRGVNVTLALIFFVLLLLALVVIGSLATLHNKLVGHRDSFNTSHVCILYSKEKDGLFKYGSSYSCEAEIYGFAVMAGVFVTFLVVCVARVVVAADIWWSALVEAVILAVLMLFTFILGLVLSSGLASTCDNVHSVNKEENGCDQNVPDAKGIKYYHAVNSAQASVWLAFFLLGITTVVYVIRTIIYFRRLRHARKSPDMQPVLRDSLEESSTKPI